MLRPPILLLLALSCVLLAFGCATTRTETPPTTPAAPAPAEPRKTPEDPEARRLVAELEASLATPLPAVPEPLPEPTPPEPIWAGYMVVRTESVPPEVAIVFPGGPEGDVITNQTLADGVQLNATTASADGGYWLFPVTRGALLFKAVRVYDDGHVTVEMPMPTQYGYATLVVTTVAQRPETTLLGYVPCARGICGPLHKATANRIVGCEGPGCADLYEPTP